MSLEVKVNEAIKEAMKAKDEARKRALRSIKAQILLLKTDGSGEEITEAKEIDMLKRMAKQREESLTVFEAQNREDLAVIEREDLAVIREFLPQQFSEEQLTEFVKAIIEQVGATSAKDMGKVIGEANKQAQGRAEGKLLAAMVKKMLS